MVLSLLFCNSVFAETKWITKKDNEPPIIQIPNTIKVNSYNYVIKGKAFDKGTDEFYIELDRVIYLLKKENLLLTCR